MAEYINKWAVVDRLTALENEFQQFKPFEGFEHAMYRKLCEVEIEIGKMPAAETVQRWVPVSERLPKAEDANRFGEIMVWLRSTETQSLWKWRRAVDHPEAITHWMPLPKPPKEVE